MIHLMHFKQISGLDVLSVLLPRELTGGLHSIGGSVR